jgi:hypothetical protein
MATAARDQSIPETITAQSEAVIAACALFNAVGEIVGDLGWHDVEDVLYGGSDRLREATFGFPLEDEHPVLLRMDELCEAKVTELSEKVGEVVLVDRKPLVEATRAIEDLTVRIEEELEA